MVYILYKLFNGETRDGSYMREQRHKRPQEYQSCDPISIYEIKEALKKVSNGKVVGPNQIPI